MFANVLVKQVSSSLRTGLKMENSKHQVRICCHQHWFCSQPRKPPHAFREHMDHLLQEQDSRFYEC